MGCIATAAGDADAPNMLLSPSQLRDSMWFTSRHCRTAFSLVVDFASPQHHSLMSSSDDFATASDEELMAELEHALREAEEPLASVTPAAYIPDVPETQGLLTPGEFLTPSRFVAFVREKATGPAGSTFWC